jgi:hypothetical protein
MLKQVESPAGESGLSAFPSELRPHVEVSPALISSVTDELLDEVRTRQNRVLGLFVVFQQIVYQLIVDGHLFSWTNLNRLVPL